MKSDIKIVEIQTCKTPVRCRTPLKFGAVVVEELPIGYVRVIAENRAGIRAGLDMTGAMITFLPTVILFVIMQKYIIQGISLSGVKG